MEGGLGSSINLEFIFYICQKKKYDKWKKIWIEKEEHEEPSSSSAILSFRARKMFVMYSLWHDSCANTFRLVSDNLRKITTLVKITAVSSFNWLIQDGGVKAGKRRTTRSYSCTRRNHKKTETNWTDRWSKKQGNWTFKMISFLLVF